MSGEVKNKERAMQTIFVATDRDGVCFVYWAGEPLWDGSDFGVGYGNAFCRYSGPCTPPPGECWEMTLTRKGDIDTDGDPIGWKIVGIGNDGSVLCEKGNGQRRRYSFGDWAKEQLSGEAWERLTKERDEALRELANERASCGQVTTEQINVIAELQAELRDERASGDQVIDERNATIAELRSELDETRTERHAYKVRLRDFCQRLVDMVGADGPEDVQGMLDKVNAEIHRLKQSIDSLSASLADKEGFLNSAGDEIQRLTEERDEAESGLRSLSTISGQTIAELRAKLERPEMPEVVRELLAWFVENPVSAMPIQTKLAAVRDYYAPPFRIDKLGVYATENGNPWEVIYIDPKGGVVARHKTTKLLENFHMSGACKGGQFSLTKYLRPLEG